MAATERVSLAKQLSFMLAKVLSVSLALHLAIFYFRLGWFLLIIWGTGFFLAVFITRSFWTTMRPALVGVALVGMAYVMSVVLVWNIFLDRKSQRTYDMTWEDRGEDNQFKESEIVLTFSDYPGHHVGIYSQEVSSYLRTLSAESVPVTFVVTKDFGCIRGFHESKIGELTAWKSRWGYAGGNGADPAQNPWPSPFWCP